MIGFSPSEIPIVGPVLGVDEPEERLRAAAREWIWDHYGDERSGKDYFVWKESWHRVPFEVLSKAFTFDELVSLWFHQVLDSEINKHITENLHVIWKVQHSLWKYGGHNYGRFLLMLAGLRRFAIDMPDFQLRLTFTNWINTAAPAVHGREAGRSIYLDAPFGVLLFYKGKHVMTTSFAFARDGIKIAQVQLREKRGNRFLYKLPMSYLDFGIDLVARAYPDEKLWLVTGPSTVEAIRRAYGENAHKLAPEIAERVANLYSQELRDYVRVCGIASVGTSDDWRAFVELRRLFVERDDPPRGHAIGHQNDALGVLHGQTLASSGRFDGVAALCQHTP